MDIYQSTNLKSSSVDKSAIYLLTPQTQKSSCKKSPYAQPQGWPLPKPFSPIHTCAYMEEREGYMLHTNIFVEGVGRYSFVCVTERDSRVPADFSCAAVPHLRALWAWDA